MSFFLAEMSSLLASCGFPSRPLNAIRLLITASFVSNLKLTTDIMDGGFTISAPFVRMARGGLLLEPDLSIDRGFR